MSKKIIAVVLSLMMMAFAVTGCGSSATTQASSEEATVSKEDASKEEVQLSQYYTLEQMVVLSRHNIRSPLSGGNSDLAKVTDNDWFKWTSNAGELSMKGGVLETQMGQYFRLYLESKGLIPENWEPEEGEVRFYTNSLQRTVATAQYFATGMLPVAGVSVEHKLNIGEVDDIFVPTLDTDNEEFIAQVNKEVSELNDGTGIKGVCDGIKDGLAVMEDVLGFKDSEYAKEKNVTSISTDDVTVEFAKDEEPMVTGGLKLGNSICDGLKLQCYEEAKGANAAWGKTLTDEEWKKIGTVGDAYQKVMVGSHTLCCNVAEGLLNEIRNELDTEGRKFTFLCAHDTTLAMTLGALNVEEYDLPNSIEGSTPIGSKLVIEKLRGADGKVYISARMVYASFDDLCAGPVLNLENPPMSYAFDFKGIEKNADGYYLYDDFLKLFDEASECYYQYSDKADDVKTVTMKAA